ncbi:putative twin-arginine translocation pathway signal protein [Burkholderia pseudomallei]|nr:putative twin-arginine translocation pathway signal protein [Burkholderia pseudomallei]VCG63151.1 putative twin-arginine translocation pathway signal protein [Burkholderia pseudomallei]VCG98463.1 putative twin-arginine translocation pathway signal protein [Burkholderia pseudomallei]VCH00243.1 putative twin-arginine translocation pathway signal protein [Burkholderia pseudomallei]VCH01561.1 putative twin-arginine translocation pathway signal protein [Burkholderia pseudomallei]
MRAKLRADPVASQVASWLGTTEGSLELLVAFACAVVLEGAAIIGWLMASVALRRVESRATVVSDQETVAREPEAVAPIDGITVSDSQERISVCPPVASTVGPVSEAFGEGNLVVSEDDLLLDKIRDAVVTGHLKPTQEAIRKFLRCGQPKAGNLNRLYLARFGTTQDQVQA